MNKIMHISITCQANLAALTIQREKTRLKLYWIRNEEQMRRAMALMIAHAKRTPLPEEEQAGGDL